MYQLDDKPKKRNLDYLIGYHFKLKVLLQCELLYGSTKAAERAEEFIHENEASQRESQGPEYYRMLGFLWACHDYLEEDL